MGFLGFFFFLVFFSFRFFAILGQTGVFLAYLPWRDYPLLRFRIDTISLCFAFRPEKFKM